MARVFFPDHLQTLTNGTREVVADAATYRDLLAALERSFPGISEALLGKVAVGDIIHDPFLETIGADSEVHFLHKIEGG
jgi:hypothetical protein